MFNKGVRINFSGNLTHAPELREFTNALGNKSYVCNLNVAVNERYTSNGVQREKTTYVRVAAWGNAAINHARNLVKGQRVTVEGTLESADGHPKTYVRDDGTVGASFNVRATAIDWGRLPQGSANAVATPTPANGTTTSRKIDPAAAAAMTARQPLANPIADDIPF